VSFLFDTARVNARTVALLRDGGEVLDSREFGLALVDQLVAAHIRRRPRDGLQKSVTSAMDIFLGMVI
jgi:hypothetical protein